MYKRYFPQKSVPYPGLFHLLPAEKKGLADAIIQRVREQPYMHAALARELGSLMKETIPVPLSSLRPGHPYGVFGISSFAFAYRNGKAIPNHGEVCIYRWTLGNDGVFYQKDAWDFYYFSAFPCSGYSEGILIEL